MGARGPALRRSRGRPGACGLATLSDGAEAAVRQRLEQLGIDHEIVPCDPARADTAAFCETYGYALDDSANTIVVAGKSNPPTYAACVVLATTRADVNGVVRRHLDVRKASFAATEVAVAETAMEYGGITPIGLPPGWPVLVDAAVAECPQVVIGSGVRRSKLRLPGPLLAGLPGIEVVDGLARPVAG